MKVPFLKYLIYSLLVFSFFDGNAQEIKVKGGFVEDSLLIGMDVHFYITAEYPPELQLFFPDSNASFLPFEFADKNYQPTELRGTLAYDSAVYSLQSFEIDPVQYFQMNAYILNGQDTAKISTAIDSIYLTELAPVVSDTTKLKTNLSYQEVDTAFNYPLLYIVLGIFGGLLIGILLIFGRRILKWIKLRKMQKQYERYLGELSTYIGRLKENPTPEIAEKALVDWKKYQGKLVGAPFSTLSTKEILSYPNTTELEAPLRAIDRTVYGRREQEHIYQDFQQIEDFVAHSFQQKVEEIKNGK